MLDYPEAASPLTTHFPPFDGIIADPRSGRSATAPLADIRDMLLSLLSALTKYPPPPCSSNAIAGEKMATTVLKPSDILVEEAGRTRAGVTRLDTIDTLRGLVIVFMVLDHVRDFFHVNADTFDPTDPLKSYPFLYATRWITHLCAPTFVFLAGVSILFQKANGKSSTDLSRFLLSRGLWLIFLDMTVVSFGFNFGPPLVFLGVIWSIGAVSPMRTYLRLAELGL